MTSIGDSAFEGCSSLTSVTIGNSVESIGEDAFCWCSSLTSITIPDSVTSIGREAFDKCSSLTTVYYTGTEEQWKKISIDTNNYNLTSAKIIYNYGVETDDGYNQEYVSNSDVSKNGDVEIDNSSNASRPYYNNTVSTAKTITGDYTVKNSKLTVDENMEITGKLYVENGEVYVSRKLTAGCIEIASSGKVVVSGRGKINSGYICTYGGSDSNSGGYFFIDSGSEVNAGEVSVYDWAKINVSGKLHATNFIIKTSNTDSYFGSNGEMWLSGDFTQKNNGALWWAKGNDNFCPKNGFTVILTYVVNDGTHNISFDNPNQSWLYNLYTETGADNNYTNTWTGNPTIKGSQKNIYKTSRGYAVHNKSNAESKKVIEQFTKDVHSALNNSKQSVKIGYGISEFGGTYSKTNNALRDYLYAYVSGMQAIYPSSINIGVHTWYETIPVYYDGRYIDIKFTFEVADIAGQKCVNVKYTYGSSVNKQCFAFMIADKTKLADTISKYAADEHNNAIADYLMLLPNEYVKNKNSKLASLLWNGIQDFQVGGFGYKVDGGKKYVKDFIKVGIDTYINKVKKSIGRASLFDEDIENTAVQNVYTDFMAENRTELLNAKFELTGSGIFADAELENAVREEIGTDGEITGEMLADIEELNLTEKYITDISGIENCTNLKKLNLSGNSVADLSPLADMTKLEEVNLSGNTVSDLSPLAGLANLKKLILKNNRISDIAALGNLTELQELDLSYNSINDISTLSDMSVLSVLDITSNSVSDLSALANSANLSKLYLAKNEIESISPLSGIKLSVLDLAQNKVSDISELDVSEMSALNLSANNITDISVLSGADKITELALGGNAVNDLAPLADKYGIWKLNINGCGISDISALKELTKIKALECADNSIEDFSPLSAMTAMEKLNVSGQEIEDFSFAKAMKRLSRLDAEQCGLYSINFNDISNTVTYLNVASNRICDLSDITKFAKLKTCNVSNNYITDILPLTKINTLESVDYSNNPIEDSTFEFAETVTVIDKNAEIALEDFYFANDNIDVLVNGEKRVKELTIPADASGYVLLWESDNTDVAEVDANGVVKGKSAGTATITAATEDGTCVDSYTVNVSESMIYNIAVNGNTASLTVKNITDTNYDSAAVVVALYDNDEVKEIKIVNIDDFKIGDTRNISAEFSDIGSGDCLQIFLWSDFASMYPIADKAGYKLFV